MQAKQQGMGLIGWLFALSLFGLVFLFGLKLFPIYYDYFTVQEILKDVAEEYEDKNIGQIKLWRSIQKHLNVNGIDYIKPDDFKLLQTKEGSELILKYEARTPYLWNLDLVAKFEHRNK